MTAHDANEQENNANAADEQQPAAAIYAGRADTYEVALDKGVCGFGIYFTAAADGAAMVDPAQPFYRLPDGTEAPGEASRLIQPGDRLLAINKTSVESYKFQDVVEELRRTPLGDITLRFERVQQSAASGKDDEEPELQLQLQQKKSVRWRLFDWPPTSSGEASADTAKAAVPPPHEEEMLQAAAMEELLLEMENKIRLLEEDVEREKKCRFLAEKKNILYRNALRSLSDDNAQLRYQLTLEKHAHDATQRFQSQKLHLSV